MWSYILTCPSRDGPHGKHRCRPSCERISDSLNGCITQSSDIDAHGENSHRNIISSRWQQVLEVVVRFDPRPPTASSVSVRCWCPWMKSNQMKMLPIYFKNVDVWPWWHVQIHIMKWWRIPPNEIILCPRSSLLKNTTWKTQHVSIALAWRPSDFWKMRQSDSATFLPK